MVQAFPFTGVLNYDDPDEVINPAHHRDGRNISFKGTLPNLQVQNIPGTIAISNPLLPLTGTNKNIGKLYDPIGKRIFFFNYNSGGKHGIYLFNTLLATFQRLVETGINTTGDPLAFTVNGIISSINIIYGDSTQGNILCYVDSLGRPSKINVTRALASGYGTIQRSFLDVAKEPTNMPPTVVYENDLANTVNNCRKKLFRVKIRWVFDDQDKAVTSSQSEMPIPLGAFDQAFDSDPTKNCRLAIMFETGPSNVRKVEILVSNSIGIVMSDFYLVASLDKTVNGLQNNDLSTFLFYNDKAYTYIDINESNQIFDYVPISCGAQTLLNGNVLSYGNITEGYPNLTNFSDGTTTSSITSSVAPYYYGEYFSKLIASQSGDSAFGTGTIHIVVRGIIAAPAFMLDTYTVYFTDGSDISYTLSVGDDAAAIIEGLRVDAIANGFTIISTGSNDLYITKTNASLARTYITSNYTGNALANTSFNVYDWSSKQGFGLVYFDLKSRTNGVVYTQGFSIQTAPYTEGTAPNDIPRLIATIYHQPPDWAVYYQWVRTKNLSKQNIVQWITDRTFKDTIALSGIIKYTYLSIESLNVFVRSNPGSPLGYSFLAGDRIRFFKRYNADSTTANLYGDSRDYEVVASLTNPTINGEEKTGQFIKIILPATDGTFDFGNGFDNYFIEVYTPAQPVANNLNLYYEYGERYAIGNPGTSGRFHQGMLQNQAGTPAVFEFTKGDYYIRQRTIQTGNVYLYNVENGGTGSIDTVLIGLNFQNSTYNDSNITAQSVPFVPLTGSFNPGADSRWFLKAIANTTFKIEGTITVSFSESHPGDSWRIYLENRSGEQFVIVPSFDASTASTHTFAISSSITLEDDRIFLIAASNISQERVLVFVSSNLTFTIDHVIPQLCIDPNFSDYFPSSVNSNGRAFVFDENANQVTYQDLYRWSLAYQKNTNINQTNRFYPQNFDEVERSYGAIMRMISSDRVLTFFQERKCGWTGVYQRFISSSGGSGDLVTTDSIITSNNVQYYAGEYGVGNQGDAVTQSGFVFYFPDPIKGDILRLSRDGITVLTELYKMKTYSGRVLPEYLKNNTYTYGGNARITGVFNVRKDNVGEYLCVLQRGNSSSGVVGDETLAFDESKNSFTSFLDFAPDNMVCAENVLYSFYAGVLYSHNSPTKNLFYGATYESSITRVFNQNLLQKKTFISQTQVGNICWDCPVIYTNQVSYGSTVQQSNLITADFKRLEADFSASFLRDINSIGGLITGDIMKGNFIVIKFRAQNATGLVTLSAVLLEYLDSPHNNR
jgi:hypothetical protein